MKNIQAVALMAKTQRI